MVASRAEVVVQMAAYLTSYSDCMTGYCEPLSPLTIFIDVTLM